MICVLLKDLYTDFWTWFRFGVGDSDATFLFLDLFPCSSCQLGYTGKFEQTHHLAHFLCHRIRNLLCFFSVMETWALRSFSLVDQLEAMTILSGADDL